jgi:hypothetical protein
MKNIRRRNFILKILRIFFCFSLVHQVTESLHRCIDFQIDSLFRFLKFTHFYVSTHELRPLPYSDGELSVLDAVWMVLFYEYRHFFFFLLVSAYRY